jgi:hypothetical protein
MIILQLLTVLRKWIVPLAYRARIALVPIYLWAWLFVRNPVSAAVVAVIGLAGVQLTIRLSLAVGAMLDYW